MENFNGNYLNNNHGTNNQNFYYFEPAKSQPSQFWVDRWCRLGSMGIVLVIFLFAGNWMFEQWQPFFNGQLPQGAGGELARDTVPMFWTLISLTYLYGRYSLRFFSSKWPGQVE